LTTGAVSCSARLTHSAIPFEKITPPPETITGNLASARISAALSRLSLLPAPRVMFLGLGIS
jgi:hypothetical protein